jgi:hypothetical protein
VSSSDGKIKARGIVIAKFAGVNVRFGLNVLIMLRFQGRRRRLFTPDETIMRGIESVAR